MTEKKDDYTTLTAQLSEVLRALQSPDCAVDDALKLYEQGTKLVLQIEAHLKQAEVTIEQLKLAASKES